MAIVHQAAAPHRAQNPLPSPHPDQVLASYVYERATHDKVGAAHMLALSPPGGGRMIAPSWLGDSSLGVQDRLPEVRACTQAAQV